MYYLKNINSIKRESIRNIFSSIIGNAFEWYDFVLFGAFASAFSQLFFSEEDPQTSMLKTYGIFAAGFIMRPLGSLMLGHIGDKYGRKPALLLSMVLIALPTIGIGFLPTYQQIGAYAPLLLILMRLVQGFAMGGEYGGSMVFLAEHAPPNRRAFYSSWVDCGCLLGVLMGTLTAWATSTYLSPRDYLAWGWRIPFIASTVLAILIFYARKHLKETTVFLEHTALSSKKSSASTYSYFMQIIPATLVYAFGNVCFYIFFVFIPNYLIQTKIASPSHSFLLTSLISALIAIFIPYAGYLSDRYGRRNLLCLSIVCTLILAYPLFLTATPSYFFLAIFSQVLFALSLSLFYGGEAAFLAEVFPSTFRCTSVSLTLSLSNIIFGGGAPFIATWIVKEFQDVRIVGLMIALLALLALLGIFKIPDQTKRPLRNF